MSQLRSATVQQMIDALMKLPDKTLPLIGVHGASGVSYEVGSVAVKATRRSDDAGPLCDVPEGTPYARIYLGN